MRSPRASGCLARPFPGTRGAPPAWRTTRLLPTRMRIMAANMRFTPRTRRMTPARRPRSMGQRPTPRKRRMRRASPVLRPAPARWPRHRLSLPFPPSTAPRPCSCRLRLWSQASSRMVRSDLPGSNPRNRPGSRDGRCIRTAAPASQATVRATHGPRAIFEDRP